MSAGIAETAGRRAELRASLRNCVLDGLVAIPIVTMATPVNVFLTALATKGWALSKPGIGLLSAMPFAANILQLLVVPWLHRWSSPKTSCVVAGVAHLLTWVVLLPLLAWLPRDQPDVAGRWLIAWFLVSSIFDAVTSVMWNTWVQEWMPVRLRGQYFGRRNRLLQLSLLAFLLLSGWVLARGDYRVSAFQAIIAGAVVLRVFSLRWIWRSPARGREKRVTVALDVRKQIEVLRRSRALLWFIAFGSVWFFAANCFGPFYQVFLFEQLKLSAFDVGILSTVSALGGAASLPAWGRLLDRHGNRPVMAVSLLGWQAVNLLWCIITPTNHVIVYLVWALGGMTSMGAVASAGFVLGQFTLLLRLVPAEAKSLAIGLNLAVTSFAAAIAPVGGGMILAWALARWPDAVAVYHACFLLQPVMAIASCLLLLKVHEPRATSLTSVVGAMRNVRTLAGVLGLGFLVNHLFHRPLKRAR